MEKRDYYEVLGVPRDATADDIKKAFRQKALSFHPDRNPGDKEAEEKFKQAAEAYSVLGDAEKRATYDRFGENGLRGEGFAGFPGFDSSVFEDFEDILGNFFGFGFGDLFGGGGRPGRRAARKGRDLSLEIQISLEEAGAGIEKEITLNRAEVCSSCQGSGLRPGAKKSTCPSCGGRGQIRHQQGFFTVARTCPHCAGEGELITAPCQECGGSKLSRKKSTLKIRVPAGIDDGSRLRIGGEGEAGGQGVPRGDLYVMVRVKEHPFFHRENQHLSCEISISIAQAAFGITVDIPTLEGRESFKIPSGTQSGEVFRLRGKGIRDLESRRTGDLFVKVLVETPTNLTKEQKNLIRELAQLRGENLERLDKTEIAKDKNFIH